MRIHPRAAVGIFGLIYIIIGVIIQEITKKEILGNIFFFILAMILGSIVYFIFEKKYDEGTEEPDEVDNLVS